MASYQVWLWCCGGAQVLHSSHSTLERAQQAAGEAILIENVDRVDVHERDRYHILFQVERDVARQQAKELATALELALDGGKPLGTLVECRAVLDRYAGIEEAALLAEGIANPLPEEHSRRLLIKSIERLRESATEANDARGLASLAEPTEVIVERILARRRENLYDTD